MVRVPGRADRARRETRTGTPVARRGRNATGLDPSQVAGLPKTRRAHIRAPDRRPCRRRGSTVHVPGSPAAPIEERHMPRTPEPPALVDWRAVRVLVLVMLLGVALAAPLASRGASSPTFVVRDDFSRDVARGWTTGDSYRYPRGRSGMSVEDGTAQVLLRAGVTRSVEMTDVNLRDVDARFRFRVDRLPGGSGISMSTVLRKDVDGDQYRARLRVTRDGRAWLAVIRIQDGVARQLGRQVRVPSLKVVAGRSYWMRTRVRGVDQAHLDVRDLAGRDPTAHPLDRLPHRSASRFQSRKGRAADGPRRERRPRRRAPGHRRRARPTGPGDHGHRRCRPDASAGSHTEATTGQARADPARDRRVDAQARADRRADTRRHVRLRTDPRPHAHGATRADAHGQARADAHGSARADAHGQA